MHPSTLTAHALTATADGWDFVECAMSPLVDRPDSPTGLVRVALVRASISHTQAQVMNRQRQMPQDRVLGHEGVGWVVEATPLAQQWLKAQGSALSAGDRVVIFPFLPCFGLSTTGETVDCHVCAAGRFEECPRLRALGVDADGLLTNYRDLPPAILHRVPDAWPRNDAGWTDLLYVEAVSQALVAAQVPPLETARHVAVVGRGPVQELTARIIESVHFGWRFNQADSPRPTPPDTVSLPESTASVAEPAQAQSQEEARLSALRVHRLDPSALPRHARAFDVIVETWADPASLADMFQALRSHGVLVRKSRPGRAVSLLRQPAPMMPVRILEAPYGSFAAAMDWIQANPGALRHLDEDAHRFEVANHTQNSAGADALDRVPMQSERVFREAMGFPFSRGGIQAALESDRRRSQIGKIYLEIGTAPALASE
jgi:threonine dehydrogenase-like Zn-dependent dehydrogenase